MMRQCKSWKLESAKSRRRNWLFSIEEPAYRRAKNKTEWTALGYKRRKLSKEENERSTHTHTSVKRNESSLDGYHSSKITPNAQFVLHTYTRSFDFGFFSAFISYPLNQCIVLCRSYTSVFELLDVCMCKRKIGWTNVCESMFAFFFLLHKFSIAHCI